MWVEMDVTTDTVWKHVIGVESVRCLRSLRQLRLRRYVLLWRITTVWLGSITHRCQSHLCVWQVLKTGYSTHLFRLLAHRCVKAARLSAYAIISRCSIARLVLATLKATTTATTSAALGSTASRIQASLRIETSWTGFLHTGSVVGRSWG